MNSEYWATLKTSREDVILIAKIAKRACERKAITVNGVLDCISLNMDLEAVHSFNPLRLADMLAADDYNLFHDVYGIRNNLNRDTLKLENCFLPRFTR